MFHSLRLCNCSAAVAKSSYSPHRKVRFVSKVRIDHSALEIRWACYLLSCSSGTHYANPPLSPLDSTTRSTIVAALVHCISSGYINPESHFEHRHGIFDSECMFLPTRKSEATLNTCRMLAGRALLGAAHRCVLWHRAPAHIAGAGECEEGETCRG